jgi:Cys-tRNA(Pro)/Cys-tRNA(Cys) deacylase
VRQEMSTSVSRILQLDSCVVLRLRPSVTSISFTLRASFSNQLTRGIQNTMTAQVLPAHQYLDECGIPYERLTFPAETEKGAANVSAALGYREDQMVKTLIFEAHTGERVLILVGGNRNAISGLLKKAIGSRNIKMAPLDAVKETTGYAVGSVPPFHWQPEGFRSFLDEALMREELLGVGAGVWGEEILLTPENLQRACNGIVVNLTERPAES